MIIARKDGKWSVKVGKWMWPKDYSRVSYGLDINAQVLQYHQGLVFWRIRPGVTHCIDVPKFVYGKYTQVWEPVAEPVSYRFKDHLFVLHQMTQYNHRPRRKPAYKAIKETWWMVLSVDGVAVNNPYTSMQQGDTPIDAMTKYLSTVRSFVFSKEALARANAAPFHLLF